VVDYVRRSIRESSASGRALWRPPLQRLYRDLIEPVEIRGHLSGKKRIVIVPHGELHAVSFAALVGPRGSGQFLVQRFVISYAPSATAWIQLARRRPHPTRNGILALAPHESTLPATRYEMRAIRRAYGARAVVLTGRNASERAMRERLSGAGTLHLATFGVLNAVNPLYSFVKLAPTAVSDGRLEVRRVFDLGLSGQLVVLSACETALGAGAYDLIPPGDDWIGLVQAFLQGGASRVVASLWPVQDRATALLMERFHRSLAAGNAASDALAAAQRQALSDPSTAPPAYWAAFVISGRSERGS
jgi:CHAT domain-containing protein